MADVSIGPPDGDRFRDADRGQLLLVAGLVVAVSLVVLVVLLNATIYTENVATRGVEAADGEALEVRATGVEGVGGLVDATNRAKPGTHGEATGTVEDGIEDLDERIAARYAKRGGVTRLETDPVGTTDGWYLDASTDDWMDAGEEETEEGGEEEETEEEETEEETTEEEEGGAETAADGYAFATDVERTRGFTVTADLDSETAALAVTDAAGAREEAFGVVLEDSDPEGTMARHEVYLFRPDDGSDDVAVAVGSDGGSLEIRCRIVAETAGPDPAAAVELDLTDERVTVRDGDGRAIGTARCPGLWPAALVPTTGPDDADGPYDVRFVNGDAADGTATATARTASATWYDEADHATPGVYDATVDLRYRTADLGFETTVRVAPGEPDA